jgi:methyltransferase (TIGR00027 family)
MRAGRASRTAEHNALFRALESARPPGRRVVDDPFARGFLRPSLSLVVGLAGLPGLRAAIPAYIDRRWPGTRTALVARTRLIDDAIAETLREAVEQVVILGAGFDTRAWRLPGLRDVAVFEVDHPDTQAAKRSALARSAPEPRGEVRFVATDFTRSDLAAGMASAGYRESALTLFLWEGTTNYLTEEAVDATLRWCARTPPGSTLLFTYIHRDALTRPESFAGSAALFAYLERVGERFTFGIEPAELSGFLAARGLSLVSDIGAAEFRERAYGAGAARMRGHEFYRVARARVALR